MPQMQGLSVGHLLSFAVLGLNIFFQRLNPDDSTGYTVDRIFLLPEYDFVIVGAGAAGCVLARRLTEIKNWNVLLIEAGSEESMVSEVPVLPSLLANTNYDWQLRIEPNKNYCRGMARNRCHWIQGKGMGGGTLLNYMLYVRGNKHDYDGWASLGNPGWDYNSVLPYFLKSENNLDATFAATPYHSRGGPLPVQQTKWETPLASAFRESASEMGYEIVDGNGESQAGFMKPQTTVKNGERWSNSKAFLRPVRFRPNLHVTKKAEVQQVLFKGLVARGVRLKKGGVVRTVRARMEVILCAGALMSPKLLMLSGIGDKEQLKRVGIGLVHHSPGVGQNLQDHISSGGVNFVINNPMSWNVNRYGMSDLVEWLQSRSGAFTLPGGVEGIAWVHSSLANRSGPPDLQFHFASGSIASDFGHLYRAHGISEDLFNSVFKPLRKFETWSVLPMILHPKSVGNITLASADPRALPLIHANYLAHPDDIQVLIDGIKLSIKMSQTSPFQRLNSTYWPLPFPACRHLEFFSDPYWECQLREYTLTEHHFSGTCKMGPSSDSTAVVDSRLRVKGVIGLRVVDASVMPFIPSGNTAAATTMIGEKGSDLIKEDWKVLVKS